jgi:hypothetical protein
MSYLLASLLGLALATAAQQPADSIHGFVFEDRDGNGRKDAGELGVAGVVVSDQIRVVASGSDGAYRLDGGGGYGIIFISTPAGFRARPAFWQKVPSGEGDRRIDFALSPAEVSTEFTFIHASDTHVTDASLPRIRMLQAIVADRSPAFVLVTGDLINDALSVPEADARSQFELFRRELGNFAAPVRSVLGNHDMFGVERHRSLVSEAHPLYGKKMYREFLGPSYYSFNFGGVHFVALDTVAVDDLWYYGGVDEKQLAWLERDLSFIPPGTTVVTFNHIPFLSARPALWGFYDTGDSRTLIDVDGKTVFRHTVSNATEVLSRLRGFRYPLALGGHIHARETIAYETAGDRTRFEQAAAVVGPNDEGYPVLSGIVLYRVRGGEIDQGEFIPLDEVNESARQ